MALFKIEKDTWVAEYEGHKIEVVNDKHMVLLIDGEEVDRQKSLISLSLTLKGKLPDIDKEVIAIINGAEKWGMVCHIIIGTELDAQRGIKDENGTFTPVTKEDEKSV